MSREGEAAESPRPSEHFARLLEQARADAFRNDDADRLARYLAELDAWRRRINLTGRLSPEELIAHALEAVPAAALIVDQSRVVDIGSGAGFPAIPLAIHRPGASFTLVEPIAKKASFLRHAARVLPLPNVTVRAARIQDVRDQSFDVATTRAVGSLAELIENASFLRDGGRLLVWTTDPGSVARELPGLKLLRTLPIGGSRTKGVAILEKPVA